MSSSLPLSVQEDLGTSKSLVSCDFPIWIVRLLACVSLSSVLFLGKVGGVSAYSQALRVSGGPGRLVSFLGFGLAQGVPLVAPLPGKAVLVSFLWGSSKRSLLRLSLSCPGRWSCQSTRRSFPSLLVGWLSLSCSSCLCLPRGLSLLGCLGGFSLDLGFIHFGLFSWEGRVFL